MLVNDRTIQVAEGDFPTLRAAREHYEKLICQGAVIVTNAIWNDFFNSAKPRSRFVKLLGVEPKAQKFVEKNGEGGHWHVTVQSHTKGSQLMAWWTKFAPYAWAMIDSEDGFKTVGLEYESINSYYGTVMGFVQLAQETWMDDADAELFSDLYNACCKHWSPSLPFDEAYRPCAAFLAVRQPEKFIKRFDHLEWMHPKIAAVLEEANQPFPKGLRY